MSSVTKILYATGMTELPENCNDCTMSQQGCNKPLNRHRDKVLKPYLNKRHKDCPLTMMGIDLSDKESVTIC